MQDDLIFCSDHRLAIRALDNAVGGLHVGRCVISDMTLEFLAPLRVVRRHKGLDAARLPL